MTDEAYDVQLTNLNCKRIWWASCNTKLHGPFAMKGNTQNEAITNLREEIGIHGIKWPKHCKPEKEMKDLLQFVKTCAGLKERDSIPQDKYALKTGDLNYIITKIIDRWVSSKGSSYATINEVVGVLNCVVAEFNRRVVGPYEDIKKDVNDDVYSPENLRG